MRLASLAVGGTWGLLAPTPLGRAVRSTPAKSERSEGAMSTRALRARRLSVICPLSSRAQCASPLGSPTLSRAAHTPTLRGPTNYRRRGGKRKSRSLATSALRWCSGGDSNPHGSLHMHLKHACMPFHHPSGEYGRNNSKPPAQNASTFFTFFRPPPAPARGQSATHAGAGVG